MKTTLFTLLLLCSLQAISQHTPTFRLNVHGSYVFDDGIDSYYSTTSYYDGQVNGGLLWGIGLEYMLNPSQGIELSYLREDTKAPVTYYDNLTIGGSPVKTQDFEVAFNYIMLGGTRYFPVKPNIQPFVGVHLGMAIVDVTNPENGNSDNATKFAWSLKGGVDFWLSEKVAIKLQTGLASIAQGAGGGLYFGTGGVSTGLSTYSTIYQFSLGGGLAFKFGGTSKK